MTNDETKLRKAFTLIELLVSMGILLVVYAISTIVLSNVIPRASQSTTVDILISDMRSQQTLAMSDNSSYGIFFAGSSYTLFKGTDFSSGTKKFTVTLDPTVSFTNITFPGSQVVFLAGSGEVDDYSSLSDSVDLVNSQTGQVTTIKINIHGATYQ